MRALRWALPPWSGSGLQVYYDPAYRLPLPSLETTSRFDLRRADHVAFALVQGGVLPPAQIKAPKRASYVELARVHSQEYLERLAEADELARIYAVTPAEVPVDELLHAIRLACGGTLQAATEVLARPGARALNLLGGFHHAGPAHGGGGCPVNDVAVAIAALRAEGFAGRIAVLDLDAHPPDGLSACLSQDRQVWLGSISGCDWGPLPGVDETVLPGADDRSYLRALDALLDRVPPVALAFVIAGADGLAGDALGELRLSLRGLRRRDARVLRHLGATPQVWLPAGGYGPHAWRALLQTARALARTLRVAVSATFDPLTARMASATGDSLGDDGGFGFDEASLAADLQLGGPPRPHRAFGRWTAEALELSFHRMGVLQAIERLGYASPRVQIAADPLGERLRLFATARGGTHLLIEWVIERRSLSGLDVLYLHWLTLRHPLSNFTSRRPPLPGQEVPGLGLSREVWALLSQLGRRLGAQALAFRPATYHSAYLTRDRMRFLDPQRQAAFEGLQRKLSGMPLAQASQEVAAGRVVIDGVAQAWEAEPMVSMF